MDDPTIIYEALMMDNFFGEDDLTEAENALIYPDSRDEYNVYSRIENSVYGRPNEPQINFRAPEMQENSGPGADLDPYNRVEPVRKPGRRLMPDPIQDERMPDQQQKQAEHPGQSGQIQEPDGKDGQKHEKDVIDIDGLVHMLIDEQLEQSRYCRSVTRAAPSRRLSRALSLIANRDYSSARSLASAYFMQSGNYYFPNSGHSSADIPYFRPALRVAWKTEVSLTTKCTNTAEKTEDVPLLKALIAAARNHAENAVDLRRLITQYSETQYAETQRAET
jgi:hypothetical protein